MPFGTLHRLPQTPGPAMLMIRLGSPVLMENNTLPLPRIFRVMDIPDMPRILRLNRHIIFLRQNNVILINELNHYRLKPVGSVGC